MRTQLSLAVLLGLSPSISAAVRADDEQTQQTLRHFLPEHRAAELDYESKLNAIASADRLRSWHDLLCDRPHIASTPGDLETIRDLADAFTNMGLEVETHWFWPYLSMPVSAELEITSPERVSLSVREPAIEEDPYSSHPDLAIGFNAYSASGEVEAGVVYANYGRKEDFEQLQSLGVSVDGKIVLARYGGNYRGYKAKYAQQHGASGLIIFTDPKDSGSGKGPVYPDGGWATDEQIQRGSIKTLPYPGDPLTPGRECSKDAFPLNEDQVDLPRIPVQPVGANAARAILQRMTGEEAPEEWRGGLDLTYRLRGGEDLRVRLRVEQTRKVVKTANVIAKLEGSTNPEQLVIVGCHHDAWGFGAGDPLSGLILVMESARAFTQLAEQGIRPRRSILFCAWGAEEFGVIGSTEWVEANRDMLVENAVAYLNLDAATMGPNFGANGSPILTQLLLDAAASVPQAGDPEKTALLGWIDRLQDEERDDDRDGHALPDVGGMGGGSDHQGFYFHCGVPSMGLHARGAPGTAYHSNYDDLHWYRKVVGEDYEPALMLTRATNVILARLAMADLLPFDPSGYLPHVHKQFVATSEQIADAVLSRTTLGALKMELDRYGDSTRAFYDRILTDLDAGDLAVAELNALNANVMMKLERKWMREGGLRDRAWFKNLYMAPDETSGYASWLLPGVQKQLNNPSIDDQQLASEIRALLFVFRQLGDLVLRASRDEQADK